MRGNEKLKNNGDLMDPATAFQSWLASKKVEQSLQKHLK